MNTRVCSTCTRMCSRVHTCVFQLDTCLRSRRTHGCHRMSTLVCVPGAHLCECSHVHMCVFKCAPMCVPRVRTCVFHLDTGVRMLGCCCWASWAVRLLGWAVGRLLLGSCLCSRWANVCFTRTHYYVLGEHFLLHLATYLLPRCTHVCAPENA